METEKISPPSILYRGKGCSVCGRTGYRGRLGIYEVLEVDTDTIKRTIVEQNFSLELLQKEARKGGMKSMFEDGFEKCSLRSRRSKKCCALSANNGII